ncbi:MAG TPA: tRNA (adenosine(37)-N6)-threonylcarbamoyltransferase complex ATPase subunit type 1 TsaE [Candidatus Saccharimonadales bacterium]|nr:tRNA (adenosine(37)-N6)-threonylcarbamoyltransferase complex ATPase subunit type 1 TsaE [Candidatus Saccharimonadales bacterium]
MSTEVTWQTKSTSSEFTEQLAERLGKALRGGEVIELVSDLGGGKTTFTRGLVRGLGSSDAVASPTFTISKVYDAGKLQVHHFDFYRLHEAGIIADELAEVAGDPHAIVVVEWGDVVKHVLPQDHLTISITQEADGTRTLTFKGPEDLEYLIKAVEA